MGSKGFMSIDYNAYNSALSLVNNVYKVVFFTTMLIFGIVVDKLYVSLYLIVSMAMITVLIGKIKLKYYLRLMILPITFIMLSVIAIAINFSFTRTGNFGFSLFGLNVFVTKSSLLMAFRIVIRALGAISCMYGLALSTPMADIIEALRWFRLPDVIIELMFLIYRFIFILLVVMDNMTMASISRGGYSNIKSSFYSFGNIAKNLLLYSFKKANQTYDAMESRGYDGEIRFYNEQRKVNFREIIFFILYLMVMICLS